MKEGEEGEIDWGKWPKYGTAKVIADFRESALQGKTLWGNSKKLLNSG